MTKTEIFNIIKHNISKVLIDIDLNKIDIKQSLKNLGANSIDRVEIVQYCMEDLNLIISRVELGYARNMEELVDILYKHIN
jgi:hypothetical protein